MGLLLLAVIPPIVLLIYVYSVDKVEKEPKGLLFKTFFFGALTVISSAFLEVGIKSAMEDFLADSGIYVFAFFEAFFCVAVVEEGGKFVALKLATWKNKEFNYTFDGIVYSAFASMGFALVENVLYVFRASNLLGTAASKVGWMRAITSIPGHFCMAVFMGYYYGLAKYHEVAGDKKKKTINLWKGYLLAVVVHGLYDFCVMTGDETLQVIFIVFIVVVDIAVIVRIHISSKKDTPIYRISGQQAYQRPFYEIYWNSINGNMNGDGNNYQLFNQLGRGAYAGQTNQQTVMNGYNQPQQVGVNGYNQNQQAVMNGYNQNQQAVMNGYNQNQQAGVNGYNQPQQAGMNGYNQPQQAVMNGYNQNQQAGVNGYNQSQQVVMNGYNQPQQAGVNGYNQNQQAGMNGYNQNQQAVMNGYNQNQQAVMNSYNQSQQAGMNGYNQPQQAEMNGYNQNQQAVMNGYNQNQQAAMNGINDFGNFPEYLREQYAC